MTKRQQYNDAIAQADWLEQESGMRLDELLRDEPELLSRLAKQWRCDHPDPDVRGRTG